ncbi:GNAT family N-acetyltransferase [Paracidovorax cattleyae]|nr:GNAT family N-acetyltransferase [Paracidovorax cattleyae]
MPDAPAPAPAPASIDPALLRSPRLRLRPWTPADRAPFAALNADPVVMEHFPAPLDRAQREIVAFTAQRNRRSQAVMARLGMRESPAETFEHPSVPEGHALRPHVLYRLMRTAWRASLQAA